MSDWRYMAVSSGDKILILGKAHVDEVVGNRLPYDWTYAFTPEYVDTFPDDKVIWYQNVFDF